MTEQDCVDRLNDIAKFESNWNGYGADPIDPDIINDCEFIIHRLNVFPDIHPTANRSIQLEYKFGSTYIELEVFDDHYSLFVSTEDNNWAEMENVTSIGQAVKWLNVLTAIAQDTESE